MMHLRSRGQKIHLCVGWRAKWLGTINAVVILKITAKSARLNFKANKINKLCLCAAIVCARYDGDREMPTFYCTFGFMILVRVADKKRRFRDVFDACLTLFAITIELTFQQNHASSCRLKRALAARALLSPADMEKKSGRAYQLWARPMPPIRLAPSPGAGVQRRSINLFLGFDTKTFLGRNKNREEFQCTVKGHPCFGLKTLSLSPFRKTQKVQM